MTWHTRLCGEPMLRHLALMRPAFSATSKASCSSRHLRKSFLQTNERLLPLGLSLVYPLTGNLSGVQYICAPSEGVRKTAAMLVKINTQHSAPVQCDHAIVQLAQELHGAQGKGAGLR